MNEIYKCLKPLSCDFMQSFDVCGALICFSHSFFKMRAMFCVLSTSLISQKKREKKCETKADIFYGLTLVGWGEFVSDVGK
jgi:hypothetical protein